MDTVMDAASPSISPEHQEVLALLDLLIRAGESDIPLAQAIVAAAKEARKQSLISATKKLGAGTLTAIRERKPKVFLSALKTLLGNAILAPWQCSGEILAAAEAAFAATLKAARQCRDHPEPANQAAWTELAQAHDTVCGCLKPIACTGNRVGGKELWWCLSLRLLLLAVSEPAKARAHLARAREAIAEYQTVTTRENT